jgi:hypothetical protein
MIARLFHGPGAQQALIVLLTQASFKHYPAVSNEAQE